MTMAVEIDEESGAMGLGDAAGGEGAGGVEEAPRLPGAGIVLGGLADIAIGVHFGAVQAADDEVGGAAEAGANGEVDLGGELAGHGVHGEAAIAAIHEAGGFLGAAVGDGEDEGQRAFTDFEPFLSPGLREAAGAEEEEKKEAGERARHFAGGRLRIHATGSGCQRENAALGEMHRVKRRVADRVTR